jgi:2,4-dienoyl-CoA reductase-like NADH-dependent reductase (Old Yellow Enzyme family)
MTNTAADLGPILSPITIRTTTLRNRIVRTAHGTNMGEGGIDATLIAYHRVRAEGGVGLSILEAASIHPSSGGTLLLHEESIVEGYRRMVDAVAPHEMRIFQQLGHLGADGRPEDDTPPWSASAIPSPSWRGVQTEAMTADQIAEIVASFARAARWCAEGGLDGVEVHCAHSYLLQQFLSQKTNLRDDDWGGDLEGRARFARDAIDAVRAAVPEDFVVGIRVGAEGDDGMDGADAAAVAEHLVQRCDVDYVSVTLGGARVPHLIFGGMHEPSGYEIATSSRVTARLAVPTLVTGRFRTLAEAAAVVESGVADMIGMTRAHIADPDVIAKTLAGHPERARPCIACNQGCVGGLARGRMACAVNPLAGFETTRAPSRAMSRKEIVVVGAGPAGLESARVAAERGHAVTVVERSGVLGGALRAAARLPTRSLIADIADWHVRELSHLGVTVETGVSFDASVAAAMGPDEIVWAVGATPTLGSLAGTEVGAPVMTSAELLAAVPAGSGRIVVVDEDGGYEALGVAEMLLDAGFAVTVVSPDRVLARKIRLDVVFKPTMDRLRGRRFEALAGRSVIGGGDSLLVVADDDGQEVSIPVDLVVVVAKEPTPSPEGIAVRVVGDAAEPDTIMGAIHSGFAAGSEV